MNSRPTIFVSTVSKELRSARQLVANTLTFLGYEPVWQDIFGTESGDLREMLRNRVDGCKGVVQLVGYAYGAEPPDMETEFGRVSYTQYEALYARKQGIKVWYLFIDEKFPADQFEPEPEEVRQLQETYRNSLKADTHLFHELTTNAALEAGVLKLRDDLTVLRRNAKRWAFAIVGLLLIITGLSVWLLRSQDETKKSVDATRKSVDDTRKSVDDTRKSVDDVTEEVRKGNETLEKIADRFESIASNGRLIPDPKTPEEHYHNARMHELGGNFSAARKEYSEYLSANLEALDPWLSYSDMLKASEGRTGAMETLRYFGDKLDPQTVSYKTAIALLEDDAKRLQRLEELARENPDFGPLTWLISREYSDARRGEQTLAEMRAEKEWLEKFREAEKAGKVLRYFIDKKEAKEWSETAEAAWARLNSTSDRVLENPVTVTGQQSNSGWAAVFSVSDSRAKELFYRLDGKGEFESTGHLPMKNPQTGLPMVNSHVPLPNLEAGSHMIEVKYTDDKDAMNGPYMLQFSTSDEQLAQGKMMLNAISGSWLSFGESNGNTLLYFTMLMSYRPVISEIHYSLNGDALDKTFEFKPSDTMFEVGDELYLTVPVDTRFAMVQVTFKDGTTSAVQKVMKK
ncbi:MAG: DUF4062 domain-containing protein [Akkermansiaceae bacterium]|nr:DUF4062 domain-containing protein [Akkermansiaceae bacterium]MDP4721778.1 DUF4062 domain-containing protein [Akkermansiaceae bacterium]MDP4778601.1 DUF4062 domain-containing protein [Akkermansiaceae bacterium]MDP4847364.1 DUF4062 domain-containing protein [Akkermansiaceae bacterium]MDP4897681.1 DUF4062 domain-containing protein [Akkermansiaceae bacterium]